MTKKKITNKQFREFLFGWLWIEDNVMKPARKKLAELEKEERKKHDPKK
jgi:hypothetical protein